MPLDLHRTVSPHGAVTTYGATNPWFDLALRWIERAAPDPVTQFHLAWHFDGLLPPLLSKLAYEPAVRVMTDWKEQFFSHQDQRTGLIESQSREAKGTDLDSQVRSAHHPNLVRRMSDFLEWFPGDVHLPQRCRLWARNIMAPQPSGHRVTATSWTFHPYISAHTSPGSEHEDTTISQPVLGLPREARYAQIRVYGDMAKAFERLQLRLTEGPLLGVPDLEPPRAHDEPPVRPPLGPPWSDRRASVPDYAGFARTMNWRAFEARLSRGVELVPDAFGATGWGPLDQDDLFDTDTLYWVRMLFDAYWLAGGEVRPDLQGSSWEDRQQRLERIALTSPGRGRSGIPTPEAGLYLRIALGSTLAWLRGAWYEPLTGSGATRPYLVRKVRLDGTRGSDRIYGDGMWNTLFILVQAFRVTGDGYYLEVFQRVWATHESLAAEAAEPFLWRIPLAEGNRTWTDCVDVSYRRGLFHPIDDGALGTGCPSGAPLAMVPQERFLEVMLNAYQATVLWGEPRHELRTEAEAFAKRVRDLYDPVNLRRTLPDPPLSAVPLPIFGEDKFQPASPLLTLATLDALPHSVIFRLREPGATLEITSHAPVLPGWHSTVVVPGTDATILMDSGTYTVVVRQDSGSEPRVLERLPVPHDGPVMI